MLMMMTMMVKMVIMMVMVTVMVMGAKSLCTQPSLKCFHLFY